MVRIVDASGTVKATYQYDAWGNITSSAGAMAAVNPLRYRGYYYDSETGFYYLMSRYYDPEIGRFLNADSYTSTGSLLGNNMFAYCLNNPINYSDKRGTSPGLAIGIMVACFAIIALDHALAANQPDGGYAFEHYQKESGLWVKGLYVKGNGFEIDNNGITVCDLEIGLISFTFEKEYATLEILDCITASAVAELDWSGDPSMDITAVASIYSPSIEFVLNFGLFSITIEGEAYIGGIGVGLEYDSETGKIKVTPPFAGIGGSFGVDIDLNS